MRHLPMRTARRRVVGALTAGLLATIGLGAPAAASFEGQALVQTPTLDDGLARAPPMGFNNWNSPLSALPWVSADNGWGPVEKDTSNGEQAAGDGRPLTVNGTVYAKGLGVHAHSNVAYYTGGKCTQVSAEVGVDDEKNVNGSVAFEIWADDKKAASTGVLTTADAAQPLTADISGARLVRLVVTDGGNGTDSDHADWGDATLTC